MSNWVSTYLATQCTYIGVDCFLKSIFKYYAYFNSKLLANSHLSIAGEKFKKNQCDFVRTAISLCTVQQYSAQGNYSNCYC